MSRGILYVKWGDASVDRSVASLKQFHPELEIHVEELPHNSTLLDKSRMFDFTPFDETLYLDTDTVVMGRLDCAFERARRYGLACCINESPWANRYEGIKTELTEYNTGVLCFTRSAEPTFRQWSELTKTVDARAKHIQDGKTCITAPNDQAAFALAVDGTTAPYVLPMNYNLRPEWHRCFFGPIKIWHDYRDVPQPIQQYNDEQSKPGAIIRPLYLGG